MVRPNVGRTGKVTSISPPTRWQVSRVGYCNEKRVRRRVLRGMCARRAAKDRGVKYGGKQVARNVVQRCCCCAENRCSKAKAERLANHRSAAACAARVKEQRRLQEAVKESGNRFNRYGIRDVAARQDPGSARAKRREPSNQEARAPREEPVVGQSVRVQL